MSLTLDELANARARAGCGNARVAIDELITLRRHVEAAREEGRREVYLEIATMRTPETPGSYESDPHCVFCEEESLIGGPVKHAPECLWLRAKRALEVK
jgi:hypothetical protein